MAARQAENVPQRRASDNGKWGRVKHWWTEGRGYRDIWLILISLAVLFAVKSALDTADNADKTAATAVVLAKNSQQAGKDIQASRASSIRTTCESQEALANLMRSILLEALQRAPNQGRALEAREFYRKQFEPLGGLKVQTPRQQDKRCNKRVEDGLRG